MSSSDQLTLVMQWPRLGPYHLARIEATTDYLQKYGIVTVALETAAMDSTYQWQKTRPSEKLNVYTLFPTDVYEEIPVAKLWREVFRQLDRLDPQIVAICGYQSYISSAMLAWSKMRGRSAILMSESKADDVARRSRTKELLKRAIVNQYHAALVGGQLHSNYLQALGMNQRCIEYGYDVVDNAYFFKQSRQAREALARQQNPRGISEESSYFLASSRFVPRKNLDLLIRAYGRYRRMCEGMVPWHLVVLGEGELRPSLEKMISSEQIEGISLPGFVQIDDLPTYYGGASVFIHAALQEQWGLVVNEAMATGLPVLVSERCGCVPELVKNGVNGFAFDAEDEVELAELMYGFSSGHFDFDKMGRESLAIVADWTPERFARGMHRAIENCAKK